MPVSLVDPRVIDFGRDICGDLAAAEAREWLVTNGIGGFACGTVAGTLTRRYHGLLVAALPPRGIALSWFPKLMRWWNTTGKAYALGANRWAGGAIDPLRLSAHRTLSPGRHDAGVDLRLRGRFAGKANLDGARREHDLCAIHRGARPPPAEAGRQGLGELPRLPLLDARPGYAHGRANR